MLNILDKEIIMFPINLNQTHWALITVVMHSKTINYYDSLYTISESSNNKMILISYLLDSYFEYNKFTENLKKKWIYNFVQCNKQENGYDCGVFVCKFMDYISRGQQITFSQKDMKYFRILIAGELFSEKIFSK